MSRERVDGGTWMGTFCRRDMDGGVKKDIWSVMEDFSKAPGDFLCTHNDVIVTDNIGCTVSF